MPFDGPDIWEDHLYSEIPCPENIIIPVNDPSAWTNNPGYRWAYNKMNLCTIQSIRHGPHGIDPNPYPVFSKPIYNLWGMGMGSRILTDDHSALVNYSPGHFWMEILEGEHVSLDVVFVNGKPKWWSKSVGISNKDQTFDHWTVNIQDENAIDLINPAILKHLSAYTGHVNFEIIGNTTIEVHLRLSGQFVVFYGKRWLNSIVSLYENQKWDFTDSTTAGYSVPLFMDPEIKSAKVNDSIVNDFKNNEKILDIQVCIDEYGYVNSLCNPVGGNLIAIINSTDLDEALKTREILKENIIL